MRNENFTKTKKSNKGGDRIKSENLRKYLILRSIMESFIMLQFDGAGPILQYPSSFFYEESVVPDSRKLKSFRVSAYIITCHLWTSIYLFSFRLKFLGVAINTITAINNE